MRHPGVPDETSIPRERKTSGPAPRVGNRYSPELGGGGRYRARYEHSHRLLGLGTAAKWGEYVDYPKGRHLKGGTSVRITTFKRIDLHLDWKGKTALTRPYV